MRIRKATLEDEAALRRLVDEARRWWGHPTNWTRLVQSDLPVSKDFISSHEIYVAEESTGPVGFYVMSGNKLEELWITPSHFGTGVGKELFLHAKDYEVRTVTR